MIVFAAISPHPPILLPSVGSKEDRKKLKKTLCSLDALSEKIKKSNPNAIIISSPHNDWGFNVPLFFLAKNFSGKIDSFLTGYESPEEHFEKGKNIYKSFVKNQDLKIAIIASGDLSHHLKDDGPYGFHINGPKFDLQLIESLKKKDLNAIFNLDKTFPNAGECGLRSFCFLLGMLDVSGVKWNADILSYEGPFGVGYLVVDFKIRNYA